MGSEVVLYIYGLICLCMIGFNVVYSIVLRNQDNRLNRNRERLKMKILTYVSQAESEKAIPPGQIMTMRRRLRRERNLIAFDEVLSSLEDERKKHGEASGEDRIAFYLSQMSQTIIDIAGSYVGKDNIHAAYYAYFISRHNLWLRNIYSSLRDIIFRCYRRKGFYCKINAMQALAAFSMPQDMVKVLQLESGEDIQVNEKIVTEILMEYRGDTHDLISLLWDNMSSFSDRMRLASMNFIRFKSGEWKKEMYSVLTDDNADKELRFSAARYFGKYPWEPARKVLMDMLKSDDEVKWEGAAVAASSLASYDGEDVIDVLINALHSRNWYVRYNASASLEALGQEYGDLLRVITGSDRYAREIVMYRLEEREMKRSADTKNEL